MAHKKQSGHDPVPPLEWAAAGLGMLVVLALLMILGREVGSGGTDDLPALAARIEAVTRTPTGHVAQFVVSNDSGQTAAAVPGHSEARGGLLFPPSSGEGTIELRVTGYELP